MFKYAILRRKENILICKVTEFCKHCKYYSKVNKYSFDNYIFKNDKTTEELPRQNTHTHTEITRVREKQSEERKTGLGFTFKGRTTTKGFNNTNGQ